MAIWGWGFMRFKSAMLYAVLTVAAATSTSASVTTFSDITGTWSNAVLESPGPPFVTYTGNGTAAAQARWGTAGTAAGQSGYNFGAISIAPITVNPGSASGTFALADFAHVNEPIYPPSITSINLTIRADVTVDGTDAGFKNFTFNFLHDETPNDENPCPYGGADNQGININGCADRVAVNYNHASDTFTIGNDLYTLNITGFILPGSSTPVGSFLTEENMVDNAQLVGDIVLTTSVPEPTTWSLMIGGLGLLGGAMRRRRAVVMA